MSGAHALPRPASRFRALLSRRVLGVPVFALVAVVLAAGVALAVFLASARMSGSVNGGTFAAEFTGTPTRSASSATGCPVAPDTTTTAGVLTFPASSGAVYPGDSCTYGTSLRLSAASASPGELVSVTTDAPLPAGWTVSLIDTGTNSSACGLAVTNAAGGVSVAVKISRPADALADGSALDLSTLRVNVSPDTSGTPVAAACTVTGA